ncbi:hypothetical protein ACEPAI_3353 [Sanghuangporus weigelae]
MSIVHVLSPEQVVVRLNELRNCLKTLPDSLPYSNHFYNFTCFAPNPESITDYGAAGAERGPGLEAVVDVLDHYNKSFSGDAVLQKWIFDLIDAAINAGGTTIPIDPKLLTENEKKRKNHGNGTDQQKKKLVIASTSVMDRYFDVDRSDLHAKKGKGGRPQHYLVDLIVIPCRKRGDSTNQLFFRCVGAPRGCEKIWKEKNGWKERYFAHAAGCSRVEESFSVPDDLKAKVNDALGCVSLGSILSANQESQDSSGSHGSATDLLAASRSTIRTDETPGHNSVENLAKKAGRAQLSKKINHAILKLICVCGIPPTIIDSKEWKDLLNVASPNFNPTGSKTFVDSLIPREAAYIKTEQVKHLQGCTNLTISFDGGTTASLQSIYTVHVTTPARRTFLLDGNEASDWSHTGEHIFNVLDSVMNLIGPSQFRGITSDNTGNTLVARLKVREKYPWVIILPDPCHRLNLLCKDIAKIDYFKAVIKNVQHVVKFFRKSSQAVTDLKKKRSELAIMVGIKSIGKTRFGTVFFSAQSIEINYPAISDLVKSKKITVPDVNNIFTGGRALSIFRCGLQELTMVLAPIAKSITCLESAHSTVADIYVFWLAVAAEIHRILDEEDLEEAIKDHIRRTVNFRFDQMINDAPSDVYITGFILDPRFRGADIHRELNPNVIKKLKIPARDSSGKPLDSNPRTVEMPAPLRRAGNFLLQMLRDHTDHAGNWWKKIDQAEIEDAQPLTFLARSLFELLPNSMADERTASTMNWFNSPLRNKQDASTIVRMMTVRQWYLNPINHDNEPFCPVVRFRDMKETIFGKNANGSSKKEASGLTSNLSSSEEDQIDSDDLGNDVEDVDLDTVDEYEHEDNENTFSSKKLDVEGEINLKALILLDLLADDDRAAELKEPSNKGKQKENEAPSVCFDEMDMDLDNDEMWSM